MNINNKKIRIGYSTVTIKKQAGQFIKDNMVDKRPHLGLPSWFRK